jgi:hypothetical protein
MDPMVSFEVVERRFVVIESKLIGNRVVRVRMERPEVKNKYVWNYRRERVERLEEEVEYVDRIEERVR